MTKKQTNRKKYPVHNNNKSKKIRGGIAPAILLIENLPMIASYTSTSFDTLMKWLNTANTAISTYDKIKHHEPILAHPIPESPTSPTSPTAPTAPTSPTSPTAPTAPTAPTPPVTKKPPVKSPTPVTKKPPVNSPTPVTKKPPVKSSSSTSMIKKPPIKTTANTIPMTKKK